MTWWRKDDGRRAPGLPGSDGGLRCITCLCPPAHTATAHPSPCLLPLPQPTTTQITSTTYNTSNRRTLFAGHYRERIAPGTTYVATGLPSHIDAWRAGCHAAMRTPNQPAAWWAWCACRQKKKAYLRKGMRVCLLPPPVSKYSICHVLACQGGVIAAAAEFAGDMVWATDQPGAW